MVAASAGWSGSSEVQVHELNSPPVVAWPEDGVPSLTGAPTASSTSSGVSRSQATTSRSATPDSLGSDAALGLPVGSPAPLPLSSPPHPDSEAQAARASGTRARRKRTPGG